MQRFEGPRCLFLEDTCGSSLDALGYNCHSSQEEQLGPEIHRKSTRPRRSEPIFNHF